jgi:hypothetical protein
VTIVQKGYGTIKVGAGDEVVPGKITLYADGWVAVAPLPPAEDGEARWFPSARVHELVWQKSLATTRPG